MKGRNFTKEKEAVQDVHVAVNMDGRKGQRNRDVLISTGLAPVDQPPRLHSPSNLADVGAGAGDLSSSPAPQFATTASSPGDAAAAGS